MQRYLIPVFVALCCSSALAANDAPIWSPEAPVDPAIPVVLVVEMGSGQVLYARQADLRFAPASITKVMTAFTAFELIEQRKLREDQRFAVSDDTFTAWSGKGTSMNLQRGESVSVEALLRGITTVSANDAAVVLAEGAGGSVANWTAMMNANARQLGMNSSYFGTPNGWMDGGVTFVSAGDLVTLGSALITRHRRHYQRYFGKRSMVWNDVTQQNRDPALGLVDGADGIKTGYTGEAGYNYLGSAERGGQRLIVVVGGASSEEQRAMAARNLLEWGLANWDSRSLFAAGVPLGAAKVQGGDARRVSLRSDRAITIALPGDGRPRRLSLRLVYNGPLQAPVKAGSAVAQLELTLEGMPPSRVPLVAANDVGVAGPLDRLWNGLMGLIT